jgi:hypothetical protein
VLSRSDDLRGFRITAGGREAGAQYSAEDDTWVDLYGNPVERGTPHARLIAMLSDLTAREVAAWESRSPTRYGFHDPSLTVELAEADVQGKRIVVGSRHPDGGFYATGPASDYVLVISEEQLRDLMSVLPEESP